MASNPFKGLIEKADLLICYIIVAVCAILIAGNIALFIFIPKVLAPVGLIFSNVITIVLCAIAISPISIIFRAAFSKKARELVEKEKEEQLLKDTVQDLQNQNRELVSKLDTWGQMAYAPTAINFSARLETMIYEKKGYLVKEESLNSLISDKENFSLEMPQSILEKFSKWKDDIAHTGEKTVLYIGKQYAKRSLGIDFTRIKFAFDQDKIALYGAEITKIHNLESEKDKGDIEHCWVLNNDPKDKKKIVTSINTAEHYSELPKLFAEQCQNHAKDEVEAEVENLCRMYTTQLQNCLSEHFPGIVFYDTLENTPLQWHSFNDNAQDTRVASIAAGLFLVANLLKSFNAAAANRIEE